jgi:dipeptide/tripeptide permease
MQNTSTNSVATSLPAGLVPLFAASLLERFAYYLVLSSMFFLVVDGLGLSPEEHSTAMAVFFGAAFILPLFGGLIGDLTGHGRTLLIGAILFTSGCLLIAGGAGIGFAEASPSDGAPFLLLGIVVLVHGLAFFNVPVMSLLADLHDGGRHRLGPLASYVVLYAITNLGALLAPLVSEGMRSALADGLGADRVAAPALTLAISALASAGAVIAVAVALRALRAADRDRRARLRTKAPAPDYGTTDFRGGSLPLVFVVLFFLMIPFGSIHTFAFRLMSDLASSELGVLTALNPAVVVILAPVAAIIYSVLRGRGRTVNPLVLVAGGAALTALGYGILLVGSLGAGPGAGGPLQWYEDPISPAWPYLALAVVTLGEILLGPAIIYFAARTAPLRVRGLLLAVYMAVTGLAYQSSAGLESFWGAIPPAGLFGGCAAVAGVCAGMVFLISATMRRQPG